MEKILLILLILFNLKRFYIETVTNYYPAGQVFWSIIDQSKDVCNELFYLPCHHVKVIPDALSRPFPDHTHNAHIHIYRGKGK